MDRTESCEGPTLNFGIRVSPTGKQNLGCVNGGVAHRYVKWSCPINIEAIRTRSIVTEKRYNIGCVLAGSSVQWLLSVTTSRFNIQKIAPIKESTNEVLASNIACVTAEWAKNWGADDKDLASYVLEGSISRRRRVRWVIDPLGIYVYVFELQQTPCHFLVANEHCHM
jgi:hypothetical protein